MKRPATRLAIVLIVTLLSQLAKAPFTSVSADEISPAAAQASLLRATTFMRDKVAVHGGYAWVSSADGKLSHGEGVAGPSRVWVQPPGTPAVGLAFLRAHQSTGDQVHLDAARAVADALIKGQLRSGGWGYSIDFNPKRRESIPYRVGANGGRDKVPAYEWPGGWDVWRKRKFKTNKTLIDDDTTPAAIRFLATLDQRLRFKDKAVHEAATYALEAALGVQYPIGAWSHNYDRFPIKSPSTTRYPVVKAVYPNQWSRTWTKDFTGCYVLNDRITLDMIETMLLAAEVYNDDRYWYSAKRGGEFLILAQMPPPQPAWAQQYNHAMEPVWDRKFEPPAITGGESQDVLLTLMRLFRASKDERYLKPIPPALAYLKSSLRKDGKLSRYYELKTNRPIYFDKDYRITSDDSAMPDHYSFIQKSRLNRIQREYNALLKDPTAGKSTKSAGQALAGASSAMKAQTEAGGWLEPGFVRDADGKKVIPPEGVVSSATFIKNVEAICDYLDNVSK